LEKRDLPGEAGDTGVFADEVLMLQVRDGETGKLAVLFERHHRQLFSFFYRLTGSREVSEDLTQDVFFRMLKYRDSFQPRTTFTAWMYQVARNVHMDLARKRRGETSWIDEGPEPVSSETLAEERIVRKQEISMLRRALDALPVEKKEVLVLSRYQNLKYSEIGHILGCDENTVKVRVFRAVRALGQIYSEMLGARS
jgi:RNA polymerase sigma-70 factor (ECF subfamily)